MCKSLMTGGAKKSVSSYLLRSAGRNVPQAPFALIEQMETRRLLNSVVRIVAYNMAADINGGPRRCLAFIRISKESARKRSRAMSGPSTFSAWKRPPAMQQPSLRSSPT